MSAVNTTFNDLRALREFALQNNAKAIESFFGEVPPLLITQQEIGGYLNGRLTNSKYLVVNARRAQYDADPVSTWYVYPFLYCAFGDYSDDYRSYSNAPSSLMKSAPLMHLTNNFFRHVTRAQHQAIVPAPSPPVDVLIDWQGGQINATLGVAEKVQLVESQGHQWRIGHGTGDIKVVLPDPVVQLVTPHIIPAWVGRNLADPDFYHDDAYEFIQRTHIPMAKEIIAALPPDTYLIVPGDGTGLFADLWPGQGVFGDPIVTSKSNKLVRKETAVETIARAQPGNLKPVVMCSYISAFFDGDTRGFPSIWVDNRKIMDRIPGLVPLTESLYTRGIDLFLPIMLDRPFRSRAPQYHVPYMFNLLKLRSFRISILSQAASIALRSSPCTVGGDKQFADYINNSGSRFVDVEAPWLSPSVESMFYPNGTSRGKCYFVPLGNVQDVSSAACWDGHTPLYSRQLYFIPEDDLYLIPPACYVEKAYGQIFFAVRDDVRHVQRNVRVGTSFATGGVSVRPRPDSCDSEPVFLEEDQTAVEDGVQYVSPHDLTDFHVESILREQPLGSNKLREAIKTRWPSLVFSREQLLSILKSNLKYRMGPNHWSVSFVVGSNSH